MALCLNSAFSSVFTIGNTKSIPNTRKDFLSPDEQKLAITKIDISVVGMHLHILDPNKYPGPDGLSLCIPRVHPTSNNTHDINVQRVISACLEKGKYNTDFQKRDRQ